MGERPTVIRNAVPRRRLAFTLAEALLAAIILAIVTASASLPFAAGVQNSNEAARLAQAVALGQALLEEVLARPFYEPGQTAPTPGPDSGETSRVLFDGIDDFHGYTEAFIGLRDFQGIALNDATLAGLWRDVSVQYVAYPNQQPGDINNIANVRVRVFDGNEVLVTLSRIVVRED